MARRRKNTSLIQVFLGLSLVAHVQLALVVAAVVAANPEACQPAETDWETFEVALVPDDEVQDTRQLSLEKKLKKLERELEQEEEEKKDDSSAFDGQVVDLPPPKEEQVPDKPTKYLSQYDSKVDKETRARQRQFRPGALVPRQPLPQQLKPKAPDPAKQTEVERKLMKLAMRPRPRLPDSNLPRTDDGTEAYNPPRREQRLPPGPTSDSQEAQSPSESGSVKDLQLSEQELMRVMGSRTNDYLEGVQEGEQTLLNSRRFKYATFFQRVKRQVAQNWHPARVYRRRDPTGHVYGFKDRYTVLRVRLTPEGKLSEVHLERPSGVGFLDDEAITAFRAAEPFPNPPRGLVNKDSGMISFRFGFMFEISSKPTFRIYRNN